MGEADKYQDRRLSAVDLKEFLRIASTYVREPTPAQVEQILTYVTELLRWNEKINLTAAKGPEDLLLRHVLDSLVPLAHLTGANRLLDVGPGGGFPGIPIKIFRPELFVALVEARRKRAAFNQHIVDMLDMRGIEVVWGRLGDEEVNRRFGARPFDAVITRAALSITQILDLGIPLLLPMGTILLMKGEIDEPQMEELNEEAAKRGRRVVQVTPYRLPGLKRTRNLVLIR